MRPLAGEEEDRQAPAEGADVDDGGEHPGEREAEGEGDERGEGGEAEGLGELDERRGGGG